MLDNLTRIGIFFDDRIERKMTDYWQEYKNFRNTVSNRDEIRKYELEKLWPETRKRAIEISKEVFKDNKPRGLILTVGFSPEPLAATILAIEPDYICMIHTKESESVVAKVQELTKISVDKFKKFRVDKDVPVSIYDKIRLALKELLGRGIPENKIALDPTGGTKVMPFIGGVLTQNFNLSLIYVSNKEYDKDIRRPVAGTEYFVYEECLHKKFPDGMFNVVLQLMCQKHFSSAFDTLKKFYNKFNINHILLLDLLKALWSWDSYNYEGAEKSLKNVHETLVHIKPGTKSDIISIIGEWEYYLNRRKTEKLYEVLDLIGRSYRLKEKSAMIEAAVVSYSALERLADIVCSDMGINRKKPDYEKLVQINEDCIFYGKGLKIFDSFDRIKASWGKLSFNKGRSDFPEVLSLVDSLKIICLMFEKFPKYLVAKIQHLAKERNDVVHRFKSIDDVKVEEFLKTSVELLRYFWNNVYQDDSEKALLDHYIEQNPISNEGITKLIEICKELNLSFPLES